jgi:urease accessory protein
METTDYTMPDFSSLPELKSYTAQPKAMYVGAPGKTGYLRMRFSIDSRGRSVLSELSRRVPVIVQQELYFDEYMPEMPCVYILSSGGPNVDGDRYRQEIVVEHDAFAHISTGAATKIASMRYNYSALSQCISLSDGAYLEYLPEPVIPCRHARYVSDTQLSVSPTATLVYSEIYLSGRKHYGEGEQFCYDLLSVATTGARPDGEELFREKYVVRPSLYRPQRMGVMSGYDVLANVVIMSPPAEVEAIYRRLRSLPGRTGTLAVGVSHLPFDAGLQVKILTNTSQTAKMMVRHVCSQVRQVVKDAPLPEEFPWR